MPDHNAPDPLPLIIAEHRRLAVLTLLDRMPGRVANDRVLRDGLAVHGFVTGSAETCQAMQWLADRGLIAVEAVDGLLVGRLTQRGEDALRDVVRIDGVRRPSPSE